jgi:hypothetical protein
MRSYLFTAVITGLALAAPARADDLDKYLPENTGFYVHVNINRLLSADVVRKAIPMAFDKYGDQILPLFQLAKAFNPDVANIPEDDVKKAIQELKKPETIAAGFDAAKDILTDIVIAGDPAKEDKVIVLIKGPKEVTEDAARGITALVGLTGQVKVKEHKQAKATIFEIQLPPPQQDQSAFVAVPEPGVVCFAAQKDVLEKALAGNKGGLSDTLKPLVSKRTPKDFLFVAVAGGPVESGIKTGYGNVVLEKDITGSLTATYASPDKAADAAKQMNESLSGFANSIKDVLQDKANDVKPVLDRMKATATGASVTGQFTVPGSVIEKLLAKDK